MVLVEILKRRNATTLTPSLCSGPGKVSKALGITRKLNKADLTDNEIWLEEFKSFSGSQIIASKRIGIDYAKEDTALLWRFNIL